MDSYVEGDVSPFSTLPPFVSLNQREKVLAEEISTIELISKNVEAKEAGILKPSVPMQMPVPRYPLAITWSPEQLIFEIKDAPIVQRLWVWNSCTRSIYIHCCDIWGEMAYLGARWRCYPQTSFLLAPGIMAEVFVRASPKEVAPVPCAYPSLQLAAAHKRDVVIGYFAVPINVKFLNHIPIVGEAGG